MSAQYYYLDADGQTVQGPVVLEQVWALAESGALIADTLLCKAGSEDWSPLQSFPELRLARSISISTPVHVPAPRSGSKTFLSVFFGVSCAGLLLLVASRFLLPSLGTHSSAGKSLNGEVFIVTKGGQNYKLGLVPVLLYQYEEILPLFTAKAGQRYRAYEERDKIEHDLDKESTDARNMTDWCHKQTYNLSPSSEAWKTAYDAYVKQREKSDAITKRHKEAIAKRDDTLTAAFFLEDLPKPLFATQTNSDGKFSLLVPDSGRYVLVAEASRSVGDDTEHYQWFVSVPVNEDKENSVMLSNQNLSTGNPLPSLGRTLAPN